MRKVSPGMGMMLGAVPTTSTPRTFPAPIARALLPCSSEPPSCRA